MSHPKSNHYGVKENPIIFSPYFENNDGEGEFPSDVFLLLGPMPEGVFLLLDGGDLLTLGGL